MKNISWGRRILVALKLNTTRIAKLIRERVVPLVKLIYSVVRPTLFRVYRVNKKISNIPKSDIDQELPGWQVTLRTVNYTERELAVNTLYSLFESDQNRIRSVESKARGVMQTAALVLAGDAVALNLALREEISSLVWWIISPVLVSVFYLFTALWASLSVEKPGELHVLDPDDVLPAELAVSKLATSIELNRRGSIARTNLTESAIFDVARALFFAFMALLVAVLYRIGIVQTIIN